MADLVAAPAVAPAYPAPGSAVPGAPPALRRALSPADGVSVSVAATDTREVAGADPVPGGSGPGGSRFTAAAAMLGVAVGLELAGLIRRGAGSPKH